MDKLRRLGERFGILLSPTQLEHLALYLSLLARWNQTINLTSLELSDLPDATLDRLVGESLAASGLIPAKGVWYDLGSGGGSPAWPLRILQTGLHLTMVESRVRKAAFLREVARALGAKDVEVLDIRFEELVKDGSRHHVADMVTVRAVRVDEGLINVARTLLKRDGQLFLFGAPVELLTRGLDGFAAVGITALPSESQLGTFVRR